jgi:hypothetical protein
MQSLVKGHEKLSVDLRETCLLSFIFMSNLSSYA